MEVGKKMRYLFVLKFAVLVLILYYFNIFFIGITSEGGSFYSAFLDQHFNYITGWRESLIFFSSFLLELLGYEVIRLPYHVKIIEGVKVGVGYSCLGYGVMSVHAALAFSFPFKTRLKLSFLFLGLLLIYLVNVIRIALVGVAYTELDNIAIDHHLVFNIVVYIIIFMMMMMAINKNSKNVHTRT